MLSDAWIGQHRTEYFHHPRELSRAGLLETRGLNWGGGVEGHLAMLGFHNRGSLASRGWRAGMLSTSYSAQGAPLPENDPAPSVVGAKVGTPLSWMEPGA